MLPKLVPAITLLALLGSGLMAGLFFAYSNSVMPALAKMPGPQGMTAMNHINVVIQNPLFLLIFTGTAVLALLLVAAALLGGTARPAWILTGALLYLVGNIAVTFVINVPMNDALAAAGSDASGSAAIWATFLDRWVSWNHVRAVACTGALAAFAMAIS
ncbi:DUF1772 domain-containing protein [Pseudaminobacter salicylatoxidans]|uniref:anthrone oxygenase family protein n=1 Tax=Pseudaminobacter salicylatoxidans TaxID=93369 RepID=UPI0002FE60F0|nr:anthrone oxygenase family protein [Pseudaminobacter salicylatoxidans]